MYYRQVVTMYYNIPENVSSDYDDSYVDTVNRTYRRVFAEKTDPQVIQYIVANQDEFIDQEILDFGAGKDALQAVKLNEQGYHITPYDMGKNFDPDLHNPDALEQHYDTVYASNVLNVQPEEKDVDHVIELLYSTVKDGGTLVANYAETSGRKTNNVSAQQLKEKLEEYFETVERVGGTKNAPVYRADNPIRT